MNYLQVKARGKTFGAGNTTTCIMMLIATYRRNMWTPAVFYKKLLYTAAICLSQAGTDFGEIMIWKSFIFSRVRARIG